MYQKYSIGTMAKLMGISAEAIRYYESRNIISPVRDPETGYRYYNTGSPLPRYPSVLP